MRAELQKRPLDPGRKKDLQEPTRRLEQKYGYEVLAGAPRITGSDILSTTGATSLTSEAAPNACRLVHRHIVVSGLTNMASCLA